MLSAYTMPIQTAFLFFPAIAAVLVLPVYIYQYRKFGFMNMWRLAAIYAFVLYLMCAYFLVILPLPPTRDIIALLGTHRQTYDLVPFSSIMDIIRETQVVPSRPSTYLHLLRERAFLQVAFNLLLTVPFGMFLRYLFRLKLGATTLITFCLTLFFETSQLTGLFGIYNAPYRLFSVDDLMQNTLGGMLGYALVPALLWFIPSLDSVDTKKRSEVMTRGVGVLRRCVALLIDWVVLDLGIGFVNGIVRVNGVHWLITAVGIALYFVLLPYMTRGYTLGKWLVRVRLVSADGSAPTLRALAVRAGVFYGTILGINGVLSTAMNLNSESALVLVGCLLFFVLVNLLLVVNFIANIRSRSFFHDRVSGVVNSPVQAVSRT